VDNTRFTTNHEPEASALRASLNIDENDILIVYAGKFEPIKNVAFLLTAFIAISKSQIHLLLVGNGIEESKLKSKAKQSTSAENIHFLDFQNQSYMPVLYQAADLFCLPSVSETWGLAVNEAMACSKAILVSDKVGCAVDLVKDGYNGMTFKSGNATDIKRCLDQLTSAKALLKQYGHHSSIRIKDWNFLNIALAIEKRIK